MVEHVVRTVVCGTASWYGMVEHVVRTVVCGTASCDGLGSGVDAGVSVDAVVPAAANAWRTTAYNSSPFVSHLFRLLLLCPTLTQGIGTHD